MSLLLFNSVLLGSVFSAGLWLVLRSRQRPAEAGQAEALAQPHTRRSRPGLVWGTLAVLWALILLALAQRAGASPRLIGVSLAVVLGSSVGAGVGLLVRTLWRRQGLPLWGWIGFLLVAAWVILGVQSAWEVQAQPSAARTVAPPAHVAAPALPAALPANVRAFVRLALPYARQAHQALGWQTSVILAQWGLEHGWQVPGWTGWNWGNTTYAPGCPRIAASHAPGAATFCDAPTPQEGLREYLYTARLPWYAPVTQAARHGAEAAAVALGRSPWAASHYTADGHPGDALLALLRHYHLTQFD